jgi:tetratricopeptide (TPR) repeat protein/predicted aspartyl protease
MSIRPLGATLALLALAALPGQATLAQCRIGVAAELKVTMEGMRPIVAAKINGRDAKFVADSGAFFSMIGTGSAAEYDLETVAAPPGFMLQGVGGLTRASVTTVKEFTLAGVQVHDVQFLVGGGDAGSDAVGLLGQNVWRLADAEYDLANGVIRLMKPQGCEKDAQLAYWAKEGDAYSVMDIAWATSKDPHTTGTVYLNGKKLRAVFDTGASASMLTVRAAKGAGVTDDSPDAKRAGLWRGIGSRAVQSWIAPFDTFKIGDEEIRHTKLRFGDLSIPDADMLIGSDFFLSHRIYVASSQGKLYFTYNGGPVFNLEAAPGGDSRAVDAGSPPREDSGGASDGAAQAADAGPNSAASGEPTDAAGFSRRGTAFAARRDFEHAIADLTRATELAPNEAAYFFERAGAYLGNRQPQLAMSDFDRAIELKPDYVPALVARAGMHLARGELAGGADAAAAIDDLDRASAASDNDNDVRFELANLYARATAYEKAVDQYDLWLEKHTSDARSADARAGRGRARALLNRDLDDALSDCDRAVRARPEAPFFHDSRGLVYLRMGKYDKAVDDYDAALRMQPRNAWALYGRGIARLHEAMETEGRADIAAARMSAPAIVALAERLGIKP